MNDTNDIDEPTVYDINGVIADEGFHVLSLINTRKIKDRYYKVHQVEVSPVYSPAQVSPMDPMESGSFSLRLFMRHDPSAVFGDRAHDFAGVFGGTPPDRRPSVLNVVSHITGYRMFDLSDAETYVGLRGHLIGMGAKSMAICNALLRDTNGGGVTIRVDTDMRNMTEVVTISNINVCRADTRAPLWWVDPVTGKPKEDKPTVKPDPTRERVVTFRRRER